jgi:alginate O-acetyltransferase complex protein AlgJ
MLHPYRRMWFLWLWALLAIPMIVGSLHPDTKQLSADELRALAPPPAFPKRISEWKSVPGQVDAYLRDHFGFRQGFIRASAMILQTVGNRGSGTVLVGTDGRLFYRGDQAVQQSAGLVLRRARIADTVETIASLEIALRMRGIKFVVAVPPNAATVYADALPNWARNPGTPTEYDLLLKGLAERGILGIDLRRVLEIARREGETYRRTDTHWTPLGGLAAFNAIAKSVGHLDWELDPARALGADANKDGGDLARMLGIASELSELERPINLPKGVLRTISSKPKLYETTLDRSEGPAVLVIGDSFTDPSRESFAQMILSRARKMLWLAHSDTATERRLATELQPDEVWYMPTERFMLCITFGRADLTCRKDSK